MTPPAIDRCTGKAYAIRRAQTALGEPSIQTVRVVPYNDRPNVGGPGASLRFDGIDDMAAAAVDVFPQSAFTGVCMYVCIHVCVRIMYVFMYVCMYVLSGLMFPPMKGQSWLASPADLYVCMYVCVYVYMCEFRYICVSSMYVVMYVRSYVFVCYGVYMSACMVS
jgi:hypothetical protein